MVLCAVDTHLSMRRRMISAVTAPPTNNLKFDTCGDSRVRSGQRKRGFTRLSPYFSVCYFEYVCGGYYVKETMTQCHRCIAVAY